MAPGNSFSRVSLFTDKLFNSDNLIEFLYVSTLPNTQPDMKLINENGVILQDFGLHSYAAVIKNVDGDFKLITEYSTEKKVYALPGVLLSSQNYLLSKDVKAYPNPVNDIMNIVSDSKNHYVDVAIFSIDGKEIQKSNVKSTEGFINLDVSALSSGTYIYKIGNYSGTFIKE